MIAAQTWINQKFPTPQSKEKITNLTLIGRAGTDANQETNKQFYNLNLEGELIISGFPKLVSLDIHILAITKVKLEVPSLSSLRIHDCYELVKVEGMENLSSKYFSYSDINKAKIWQGGEEIQQKQQTINSLNSQITNLQNQNQTLQNSLAQVRQQALQERQTEINQWKNKFTQFLNKWKVSLRQEITLLRNLLNHE